ncbi:MAG: YIP1 family protein [Pseudomonadota bacterium]
MPVLNDITASYRRPGTVMTRLLSMGQREDRALVILLGGCLLMFISSLPRLAREVFLTSGDLTQRAAYEFVAWMLVWPLILYGLAALSHIVAKLFGGQGTWYGARLALFWALLAATPIALLYGLTAGFIGPGIQKTLVALLWCAVFIWFWGTNLRVAERAAT